MENIFFDNGRNAIETFINTEWPDFPNKFSAQLINLCGMLGSYEEEGVKLRSSILITNNIDFLIRQIKNSYKLIVFEAENLNSFRSNMKSLIPFSKHNWNVYIQINSDETIECGLYKSFNSIKEHSFNTTLFESDELKHKEKIFAFLIQSKSTTLLNFKGIKGNELNLSFTFDSKKILNFNDEINEFVDASFSKLKTTKNKLLQIKTLYLNIFENVFHHIHGCICVVVDKDYVDNGFFADGIWLKEPIEFSKLFTQTKSYSEEKLTSFSELFMDMLNYDGITIIDNKGRIRAYNVFVENDSSKDSNILGGARKRAAFTVINSKVKKIVGVYFQSQEGEVFYNRNRNAEITRKRKPRFEQTSFIDTTDAK
ncbi:MAG: hypothetical protein ACI4TT_02575 [Christensenellales bacterium]